MAVVGDATGRQERVPRTRPAPAADRNEADASTAPRSPATGTVEAATAARTRATPRRLSPRAAQRLQATAGNRAVARLVAQRRAAAGPAPSTAPAPTTNGGSGGGSGGGGATDRITDPGQDPKFAALKADVHGKRARMSAHPPPSAEASAAQGAAKPPADDKLAQGKAANAEKMNEIGRAHV